MERPWTAERDVDAELARALIEEQVPALAPARVEPFGAGWDNAAFLVNGEWVFRFPRRAGAVPLLRAETALLPAIGPPVPLPVPFPEHVGVPSERYPWPFGGYRMLPGRSAHTARLDVEQRAAAAAPLARFLRALHGFGADEARRLGAGPDPIARHDVPARVVAIRERLTRLAREGHTAGPDALRSVLDEVPRDYAPRSDVLVHGDFNAHNLLVDGAGTLTGVIDWGDVHLGDPASDLAIAHGFLPRAAHHAFRSGYGAVDDGCWAAARLRALHIAAVFVEYGVHGGLEDFAREGRAALANLRA